MNRCMLLPASVILIALVTSAPTFAAPLALLSKSLRIDAINSTGKIDAASRVFLLAEGCPDGGLSLARGRA